MWNISRIDMDDFVESGFMETNALRPTGPYFFVPPLEDKPQDPILDALKLSELNRSLPERKPRPDPPFSGFRLPDELAILTADLNVMAQESRGRKEPQNTDSSWKPLFLGREKYIPSNMVSWDRLRSTHPHMASSTPFLSEQDELVFASARQHIQPKFYNSKVKYVYISQEELRRSLRMTIIGTSSTLFTWDRTTEKFLQVGLDDDQMGYVIVDGKDEVVSKSVMARFLTIGTLLRRLEEFIKMLRLGMLKEGPTVHAFAHSLSTTLVYLRETLSKCSSADVAIAPSAMWMRYAIYEEILVALSALYGRAEHIHPNDYPPFDPAPIQILSTIYRHLSSHFERQSHPTICAIFAFILDTTSKEYLLEVGTAVGYGGQPKQQPSPLNEKPEEYYGIEDDEDDEEDILEALEQIQREFPDFFPKPLLEMLPAAQKSLILFRKALPDHPLLSSDESKTKRVKWLWTEEEIISVWNDAEGHKPERSVESSNGLRSLPPSDMYKPELAGFQLFDMEPGTFVGQSTLQVTDQSTPVLETFIKSFPSRLPPVTPTLPHLTSLVFRKLLDHASTLSSTLLSLFLSSSGSLNFQIHLNLLRSYLLVTSPAFKLRLLEALFSDAGEYEIESNPDSMTLRSLRRRPSKKVKESKQPWAVGLSPNLLDREIWPPVGGDLSFFLRTVIVDSLNPGKNWDDEEERKKKHVVLDEATWRIGFAIRDLPTGPGRDKWLNPLCIEALDFLYMDYKPPHPMDVLISHDILSKYQRVFAFILRLFRVECAIKSIFRMTRASNEEPIFSTLAKPRKLFLHFRFVAQSFVSSLSAYIFDVAIGGNFDPFLSRLSSHLETAASQPTAEGAFSDVFELAEAHSSLLDDILSACLLRSGQKAVGELLRQSLELVLEFCVVVGDLQRKRIQEYHAAPMIEDIFTKFRGKMGMFTKVLKGLVDKGPSSSKWPAEMHPGDRRPTGGLIALYHLFLRLDLGEWWSNTK